MAAKNTKPTLPKSASIADIEAAKAKQRPPSPTEGKKPASPAELRRLVNITSSIFHSTGTKNGMAGMGINDDADGATMELEVEHIDFYDKNPRTEVNPEFETIKESIRQKRRIITPLTVTRRPGATRYMLCEGGNTRLSAIKQLWAETNDLAFKKTIVIYRAWRSESEVLSGHLIENLARGSMSFWDKAIGIERLKHDLETERQTTISIREFESVLKQVGLPIGRTMLNLYESATTNFRPIGEWLATPVLREIQAHHLDISRVMEKFSIDAETIRARLHQALLTYVQFRTPETVGIDASDIEHHFVQTAIETLSISMQDWATYRAICKENPNISYTELLGRVRDKQVSSNATASTVNEQPQAQKDAPTTPATSAQSIQSLTAAPIDSDSDLFKPPQIPQALIQRQLSTSIGPTSVKSPIEVLEDKKKIFYRKCEEFARISGVIRHMIHCAPMPFGFYMEFPGAPLDLQEDSEAKTMGWWLLASISGQRDVQTTLNNISANHNSEWRRTMAGGTDTQLGEHELRIEQELGANSELRDFASWVQPANKAAKHAAVLIVAWHELVEYLEQHFTNTNQEHDPK
jgi:ParB family protein of integrating conjugative element (PFGI_1 class)